MAIVKLNDHSHIGLTSLGSIESDDAEMRVRFPDWPDERWDVDVDYNCETLVITEWDELEERIVNQIEIPVAFAGCIEIMANRHKEWKRVNR